MTALFLKLVNMSIQAGWLVLAILLLRQVLKRAPRAILCTLWALVALRLLLPVSMESVLSLQPTRETLPVEEVLTGPDFNIQSGIPVVDVPVNDYLDDHYVEGVTVPTGNGANTTAVLTVIWFLGMTAMGLYTAYSYRRLRQKTAACIPLEDNIFLCDYIDTPFILGVMRPRIFLPSGLEKEAASHVIAHEKAHLSRRDHWWKPLGFTLLTIYWFNPLLWVAYVLLCRDIELACDEKVIRQLGGEEKKAYSTALLQCSVPRRLIAACPLAFGEVGVKARIRSVLNYRKPAFWLVAAAAVACLAAAVCFLTDPVEKPKQIFYRGVAYEYSGLRVAELPGDVLDIGALEHLIDPEKDWRHDRCAIYLEEEYLGHSLYYNGSNLFLQDETDYLRFAKEKVLAEGHTYTPYSELYVTPQLAESFDPAELPQYDLDVSFGLREKSDGGWNYLGHMQKITLTKDNFDRQFYAFDGAAALRRNNVMALELILRKEGVRWLVLEQEDGQVLLAKGFYDVEGETDPASDDSGINWMIALLRHSSEETPYPALFHAAHPIAMAACDSVMLPDALRDELVRLINEYPRSNFPVGSDNTWTEQDKRVSLITSDCGVYELHYWYNSGYYWGEEDDFSTILTWYNTSGSADRAWKLDHDFDAAFLDWWDLTVDALILPPLADENSGIRWMNLLYADSGETVPQLPEDWTLIGTLEEAASAGLNAVGLQKSFLGRSVYYSGNALYVPNGEGYRWFRADSRVAPADEAEIRWRFYQTGAGKNAQAWQVFVLDGTTEYVGAVLFEKNGEMQWAFLPQTGCRVTPLYQQSGAVQVPGTAITYLGGTQFAYYVQKPDGTLWKVEQTFYGEEGADAQGTGQQILPEEIPFSLDGGVAVTLPELVEELAQEHRKNLTKAPDARDLTRYNAIKEQLVSLGDFTLDYAVRWFLTTPESGVTADVLWDVLEGLDVYVLWEGTRGAKNGWQNFNEWCIDILCFHQRYGLNRSPILIERYYDAAVDRMLDYWFKELQYAYLQQAGSSTLGGEPSQAYQSVKRALISWGDETLDYAFRHFLDSDTDPIPDACMWDVTEELLGGETVKCVYDTPQEGFDLWKEHTLQIYDRNGAAFMQQHAPCGWLLIQLVSSGN